MTNTNDTKSTDFKNGCIGCLTISVILVLGMGACSMLFSPKEKTEKDKLEEWYKETSNYSCERVLKEKLRDPDSYKRDSDFVNMSNSGSEKEVRWFFRAKNGFGGYNSGAAICNVSKENGGTVNARIKDE
jgi:hypothetical protein